MKIGEKKRYLDSPCKHYLRYRMKWWFDRSSRNSLGRLPVKMTEDL